MEHLKDHAGRQNDSQLNSLISEINVLSDRFHHVSVVEPYFLKSLDKRRVDAYHTIDQFYETQRRNFEQFIRETQDKQRKEIDHFRLKINDLIQEQNATQDYLYLLKDTIKLVEKDLNDLPYIQCNIRPLVIVENLATIKFNKISQDGLPLSRPCRTLNIIDDSYCWMTTNDKYLLVHHKADLYLLDRQLSIIEKTL
ncbi:unnamed protein product [Rotaria magnacalcarata]|uniref:Uncharacterized protein n=2 Tax=Rotaria magnacalcarata TaxID=392030 RepID=A0A816C1R7_9BILA|nr:unnamed protein product [Rotaria magnacalcarata]CAF2102477.1 unnamed protein product [Rotaria magnacalcarata]CAF2218207.1 unnamed protein product [Rotaria magnacalcarata]CAF3826227.1 unnamed protein product [Rotaria magnacalcarata]CAF4039684.1 unnamed protein product [Rotaria magnacalcarata]